MNIQMGSQYFHDVAIPVLWGTRAILQDKKGRLSVIDLSGEKARLEVLGDQPAPGAEFEPTLGGFIILSGGAELYSYSPTEKVLQGLSLKLPECQVQPSWIRIGTNRFSGNAVAGYGVGIAVTEHSIALGAPLPSGLARLSI